MDKITIKNKRLRLYLEYELNKSQDEDIFKEELENITQIAINGKSVSGEKLCNDLSDLVYFKNLKSCIIKDFFITDEEIEEINKLKKIEILHFDNCKFENKYKKISLNIEKLIFSFCCNIDMNLLDILEHTKYLRITSGDKINLDGIQKLVNIKELYLQSINIKDISFVDELYNLEYLNLNGSNILKNKKYINNLKAKVEYHKNNYPT